MYLQTVKMSSAMMILLKIMMVLPLTTCTGDLEAKNNTMYDFQLGKEGTAVIEYKANPMYQIVVTNSNGTLMENMYQTKFEDRGIIYFHFLKVDQKDIGKYYFYGKTNISKTKVYEFSVAATLPDILKIYEILIIVIPCVCFFIVVVTIAVAVICVRKTTKNIEEKHKKSSTTKNYYVKSGEGEPVPQPGSAQTSTDARLPLPKPGKNHFQFRNEDAAPVVSQRTTSLHHVKLNDISSSADNQVNQTAWDDRMSVDSNESWDDAEDEYVNNVTIESAQHKVHSPIAFSNRLPTTSDPYPAQSNRCLGNNQPNGQPQHSKSMLQSNSGKPTVALKPKMKQRSPSVPMIPVSKTAIQNYMNEDLVQHRYPLEEEEDLYEEC